MNGIDLSPDRALELFGFFGPKVFIALLCGGLVGLERELKHKAAGLKTNMLICVGSALYTGLSVMISSRLADDGFYGDPGRVAAQIVSGIGFLGGGAIIQSRGTVVGLTTAATIWIVAAIGIAIGLGYYVTSVGASVTVVTVLVLITLAEEKTLGRTLVFACALTVDGKMPHVRTTIMQLLESNDLDLLDFDVLSKGDDKILNIKFRGHSRDHKKFLLSLWGTDGIREVRQR